MKKLLLVMICVMTGISYAQEHSEKKPAGKITGYMFGDMFYNVGRDDAFSGFKNTAITGDRKARGFQIRRIYFTYDNDISEKFTARFRLEADQVEMTSKKDKSSKTAVFVKDAYLKWKNVFEGSDLIFGIQPPPAYEISEAAWGYRSLDKTIMDLRGIVSSRDLGLSLKGKIDHDGNYNYWVMWGNNSGVNAETDKYNRFYGHVHVKPVKNLQATFYADYNQKPKILSSDSSKMVDNNATTIGAFAGYSEKDKYSMGLEAFRQSTQNGLDKSKTNHAIGLSVFGSYFITPTLAAVGRFDYFDPSNDKNAKGDARNYFISGLNWKLDKNVSVIPNIQYETYQKAPGESSLDASTTFRITFFYTFL
jgi:hypothetical protein